MQTKFNKLWQKILASIVIVFLAAENFMFIGNGLRVYAIDPVQELGAEANNPQQNGTDDHVTVFLYSDKSEEKVAQNTTIEYTATIKGKYIEVPEGLITDELREAVKEELRKGRCDRWRDIRIAGIQTWN